MFWQLLIILKLIGIYAMPFESRRTLIILEVRGRLWCLFSAYDRSARKPPLPKKNKKSEIAKKKFGSRWFWRVGRNTANWQNFKDGLGTNKVWLDFDCELLLFLQFFSVLCHFVILYMVSIEIVSFCRIISLCNFQYRNHVHSITLMSFQIISQNLVQYKAWLDDVQRLRTVTSLDVSAVAGHHAMPAALLFSFRHLCLYLQHLLFALFLWLHVFKPHLYYNCVNIVPDWNFKRFVWVVRHFVLTG